jgi:hypothetical protein
MVYCQTSAPVGMDYEYAEQDIEVQALALPSECASGSCSAMWGMDAIQAPVLWATLPAVGSKAFRAAVVDTGVQHNHVDLMGQTNTGISLTYGTGPDAIGSDDHGHGGCVVCGVCMACVRVPLDACMRYARGWLLRTPAVYPANLGASVPCLHTVKGVCSS